MDIYPQLIAVYQQFVRHKFTVRSGAFSFVSKKCAMRKLFFLLLLFPCVGIAQQNTISGEVLDKKGHPIMGVNVFLDGSYDGATTDRFGRFVFSTDLGSSQTLLLTAIGYLERQRPITIHRDSVYFQVFMQQDESQIAEVVVKAGQFQLGNLSNAVLTPLDIVTTAGSMGNIVAALEKLPGAQIAGENGRLMVRGGDPHETQTYVNGIRVPQPYTASANGVPVRGRFSPFLFKGVNFSTGAYSAEYGNALSSILNLTTELQIEDPKTEISLSSVGVGLSNTQQWNTTSLSLHTDYTNLAPYTNLIQQDITWTAPYEQWSGEGVVRNKGEKHFMNIYASFALERLGFEDRHIDYEERIHTAVNSQNGYLNGNYIRYVPGNWKWETGAGIGYMNKNVWFHDLAIPTRTLDIHLKTKWQKNTNTSLRWLFGMEYFYQKFDESFVSPSIAVPEYGFRRRLVTGFGELSYRAFGRFYTDLGLRYTDDLVSRRYVEPRASLAYQINSEQTASLSYGLFHQQAHEDLAKYTQDLDWQSAQHSIFNYTYAAKGRNLRLELYSKHYGDLLRYDTPQPEYNSSYRADGTGRVQGVDLFWKDNVTIRNLQYWISYSLTDARKWERNYRMPVQPSYVAEHYFSVVTKYWIAAWRSQVGLTNTSISGRPYHDPNLSGFMQFKTKPQNDLSFNWSYLLSQQKILHFSVTNALGNTPVFGYQYRQQPNELGFYERQEITPNAKRFVFVGFFWTISQNKTDNQLDNL